MTSKDTLILALVFAITFLTSLVSYPGLDLPILLKAFLVALNAGAGSLLASMDPLRKRVDATVPDTKRPTPRAPQAVKRDGS